MRIQHFAYLSLALTLLVVGIAATLLWHSQQLWQQQTQQSLEYQELKNLVSIDIQRAIANYLLNGDNAQLNQAQLLLQQLLEHSQQLSPPLQQQLSPAVTQLQHDIDDKYRAAGKLAANPLALIDYNRSELHSYLTQLQDYAIKGLTRDPVLAGRYLRQSAQLNDLIPQLSTQASLLAQGDDSAKDHFAKLNNESEQSLSLLAQLPALGLYTQNSDNQDEGLGALAALEKKQPEEIGQQALHELRSLLQRLPKEIETTQTQFKRLHASQSALRQQVNAIEQQVLSYAQQQKQQMQQQQQRVAWLLFSPIMVMLLMTLLQYLFQQRMVVRRLHQLKQAVAALLDSHHPQPLRYRLGSKAELDQICEHVNQLMDKLLQREQQQAQRLQLVNHSLAEMVDKVLHIEQQTRVSEVRVASSCEHIDELRQLAEQVDSASRCVTEAAFNSERSMSTARTQVEALRQAAQESNHAVQQGRDTLQLLANSVQQACGIIASINTISEQTNLLALNAAIEAARAGEAGRGFAVVAQEVRELSNTTGQSLEAISLIMRKLNQAEQELQQQMQLISDATQQQHQAAEVMWSTTKVVRENTAQSAVAAEQGSKNAEEQLQRLTQFIEAINAMREQSQGVAQTTQSLAQQISQQASHISQTLAQHHEVPA